MSKTQINCIDDIIYEAHAELQKLEDGKSREMYDYWLGVQHGAEHVKRKLIEHELI